MVEIATSKPHLMESQEDAQTCGDVAMVCSKQEKKVRVGLNLHELGKRLGQVLNLLGRAQWKDEITRAFKIKAIERLQGMDSWFYLMGWAQSRWKRSYVSESGNFFMSVMDQAQDGDCKKRALKR